MRLTITPRRGAVTTYTMSADGTPVVALVSDPVNTPGKPAVGLKAWVESTGGAVPLKGVGDGDGA